MNDRMFVGVDYGLRDLTAVTIALQSQEACRRLTVIASEVFDPMQRTLNSVMKRMMRDYWRPKGYSQSHWRKIYREKENRMFRDAVILGTGSMRLVPQE
jgi:hypothetical protein